jgi:hypothetical protein
MPRVPLLFCVVLLACRGEAGGAPGAAPQAVPPAGSPARAKATLLLLADIHGVLRPCGCSLDLQKGGFDRLAPHLAKERGAHAGALLVHAGPLFHGHTGLEQDKRAQRERQAEVVGDLVAELGFGVIAATATDAAAAGPRYADLLRRSRARATVANVAGLPEDLPPWLIEQVGGLRVGLFALSSPLELEGASTPLVVSDPVTKAQEVLAALQGKADVVVLLSSLGLRDLKRLLRKVNGIQFAIAGGLGEHPVFSDEAELVGSTYVFQLHREGRFAGRLGLELAPGPSTFVDQSAPSQAEIQVLESRVAQLDAMAARLQTERGAEDRKTREARAQGEETRQALVRARSAKPAPPAGASWFAFSSTALPWDLPQDPATAARIAAFDEELKRINLERAPKLPDPKPGEATYVGVAACFDCHEDTRPFWEKTAHGHAWATLEKQNKTFDVECVSCHLTGYGRATGSTLGQTAGRENVQCEACHGPGSLHIAAEGDQVKRTILRKPSEAACAVCHNPHHSPAFEYVTDTKRLSVPGHGLPPATP